MNIKSMLRKISWFYSLNATIKSFMTTREYSRTVHHYSKHPARKPAIPTLRIPRLAHAPRIFFAGTDEQQDRSGLLQALERIGRTRCFTRSDGSYGQNDPRPEAVRRDANARRLWELVSAEVASGNSPDILITQTWPTLLDPAVLGRIRREFGTLVVNISMDDRHQYWGRPLAESWGGTYGLIGHIDLALTAARESVEWYEKEGCPALYFPEASDPEIFHPMPELPKVHDVSFVGGCYGIRRDIVLALRRAGIEVTTFGNGWHSGRIATEAVPALFSQSKIVLGVGTIGHCRNFFSLKMRDFDGPMSGSLYLTHDNPDLDTLFANGREIVTYRTIDECVEKAIYFLKHGDERESIAAAGRARGLREHTWDQRFSNLFSRLGYTPVRAPAGVQDDPEPA